MWPFKRKRRNCSDAYLTPGRLEDVTALIQVLGLDQYTHRTESVLTDELSGPPQSASTWGEIAKEHCEFFRVYDSGKENVSISLIARHLSKAKGDGEKLGAGFVYGLVESAIRMHDGQVRRDNLLNFSKWVFVFGALTILCQLASAGASVFTCCR